MVKLSLYFLFLAIWFFFTGYSIFDYTDEHISNMNWSEGSYFFY